MLRAISALPFALITTIAAAASAQHTVVQARGSVAVSYSDNALSAPADARAGDPARHSDLYFQITPGLVIFHDTPRLQVLASYRHPVALYLSDRSADNASDRAALSALYAASPVDTLLVGIRAQRATTRQITLTAPELSSLGTQPSGDNTLLTVNLNESLTHDFSRAWRGTQSLGATAVVPIDTRQPLSNRWVVSADFAADYRFGDDAWGVTSNHGVVITEAVVGSQAAYQLVLNSLATRWRRDLAPHWSSQLGAGLSTAYGISSGGFYLGPNWSASLGYSQYGYSLQLGYSRAIVPNVIAGPTSLSDTLQLLGAIPIVPKSFIVLRGSAGGSYNQQLSQNTQPGANAFSLVSDIALSWSPPTWPSLSIRYQHIQQFEPSASSQLLRPFNTNTATFSIGYRFPSANLPREGRIPSRRVDAADRPPLSPASAAPAARAPRVSRPSRSP